MNKCDNARRETKIKSINKLPLSPPPLPPSPVTVRGFTCARLTCACLYSAQTDANLEAFVDYSEQELC